ncbi:ATP synthase membrane subunit K, mitochondrial [Malaclemys terrapin pileata]|uniref:ATP synthase membrane subunit K, mitochondrial n=1 Tax=Malaclemys terrapin pileata TaxID=2991368 RepID=UPI0023A7E9FE|nr:ATP synthase membrane subunit K, mitochondrial [Malaclemys terrapin pileata]
MAGGGISQRHLAWGLGVGEGRGAAIVGERVAGPATMAGHDSETQYKFTGLKKYFNSYTMTGRRNYVIATYASVAMIILYFTLKPKKQTPAVTEK